jgi:hypothetical protein
MKATPESVVRALNVHKANGLIAGWQHNPMAKWPHGTQRPFYVFVEPIGDGPTIELRTLREAAAACNILASAHRGMLKKLETPEDDGAGNV